MQRKFFRLSRSLESRGISSSLHSVLPSEYSFQDKATSVCFLLAFVSILFSFYLLWVNYPSLPPQIPLFFQRMWGESQLASKLFIWFIPGLLLVFFLINYAFSLFVLKAELLAARLLAGSILISSLMGIVSIIYSLSLIVVLRYWF